MRLNQFQKKARELAQTGDPDSVFLWNQMKEEISRKREQYQHWKKIEFALVNYEYRIKGFV